MRRGLLIAGGTFLALTLTAIATGVGLYLRSSDVPVENLFEGDMKLSETQLLAMQRGSLGPYGDFEKRGEHEILNNAIINASQHWPNNDVRYELDPRLSEKEKAVVRSTLENLRAKLNSCIRFTESNKDHRIRVINHKSGCWAEFGYLGKIWAQEGYRGEIQEINLDKGCYEPGTIEHEFLHAIGIHHTQGRYDRDNFVKIIDSNIMDDMHYNFNKYDRNTVTHFDLPYDYESVMHYRKQAFSKNGGITIQTLDPSKQDIIGKGSEVSVGDIELVKKMYGCDDKVHVPEWLPWGEWSRCDATCGQGYKIRARTCSHQPINGIEQCDGNSLDGNDYDVESCKMSECPVDIPEWSPWGDWSECLCLGIVGQGTKIRARKCSLPMQCDGNATERKTCKMAECSGDLGL